MTGYEGFDIIYAAMQEAVDDFLLIRDADSKAELETILNMVWDMKNNIGQLTEKDQKLFDKICDLSIQINKYLNLKAYW